MYDENGSPIGIYYREDSYDKGVFDCYYFEKNFQGDITGIFNEAGTQVVWYDYDAWGNLVGGAWVVHDQDIFENLFYANPFRYRGYYYDAETGFYYCGSRYYDPAIGRFINADNVNTLMNTPMAYTDKNLYAYCDNNPVMRVDNGGAFWDTVFDVVSVCFSVVDVVKNPDDPWAWVGLAADVVSLAVPFATGGGAIVDVATKADNVVDLARTADNAGDAIDILHDTQRVTENIGEVAETTVKNLNFDSTENLLDHFDKHKSQFGDMFSSKDEYLEGANYVINNGQFIPELNGYIQFLGNGGKANYAFVGLKNAGKNISTFHVKSVRELSKIATLGFIY